jgi:lipid-binding SYLF domain-containing protein
MDEQASCHAEHDAHAHHGARPGEGRWRLAARSTQHCLTGCIIGEVIGLAIGIEAGLSATATIILATTLAYISGFALGLLPVMKSRGLSLWDAFKLIWIGEAVSIGVMEIVMNAVDYQMGGMAAPTVFSWMFVRGLLFAVPAGFLAAWPVNYWLLGRELKACH